MTVHTLIVEDSSVLVRLVETYLDTSEIDFDHHAVSRLSQALAYLSDRELDIVLLDLGLPDGVGLENLIRVREVTDASVIVVSGDDDPGIALKALEMGAQDYLIKGEFRSDDLVRAIQYAIARKDALEMHCASMRSHPHEGNASAMDCEKVRSTEKKLKRRNAELSALNTIAGIATRSLDLEVVLNDALDAVLSLDIFHGEKGAFFLLDDKNARLRVVVQRGMPEGLICSTQPVSLDVCICGKAVLEKKVIVSGRGTEEAVETHQCADRSAPLDVSVPLTAHERTLGVMSLGLQPDKSVETRDIKLLEAIAAHIALAIENIHRYEAEREHRILAEQSRDQLLHNERLAATGRLAASLAHELSNPLQAIHNSLEMILSFSFSRQEMEDYIQMADEEVERLIEMVNRILDFSRRPSDKFEVLNVNHVVKTVTNLAKKYLQHRHVVLRESFNASLPPVEGNPTTLGQVILNLIINGVEAMPDGGQLVVATQNPGNAHVEIRVSDSGVGIPQEQLSKIFEPFYSTKADGTGLGLSISQSIVSQHRGEIKVESESGEGTSFIVTLPAHDAES
jgi:two-component system NtrC family sensor kinase